MCCGNVGWLSVVVADGARCLKQATASLRIRVKRVCGLDFLNDGDMRKIQNNCQFSVQAEPK
jgi:hypothetical protein